MDQTFKIQSGGCTRTKNIIFCSHSISLHNKTNSEDVHLLWNHLQHIQCPRRFWNLVHHVLCPSPGLNQTCRSATSRPPLPAQRADPLCCSEPSTFHLTREEANTLINQKDMFHKRTQRVTGTLIRHGWFHTNLPGNALTEKWHVQRHHAVTHSLT